ncbi:MAG TPA: hypothetical protein VJ777_16215, partial [Mycobacterium sp.]|nr:hypothetical protein [Mycobacterium sp.]
MADETPQTGPDQGEEDKDAASVVKYWTDQLGMYLDDGFKEWETRARKIVKRYRDDPVYDQDGKVLGGSKFNALWSNIQTLQPAIYIKAPKPVAERRFLDKDPLARLASMTLERSLEVQIEVGYLHPSMQKAVL